MSNNIQIAVKSIHCDDDTDEATDDEPFVVVFAVDITPLAAGVPVTLPKAAVTVTGPWSEGDDPPDHGTVKLPPLSAGQTENSLDAIPVVWRKHCWGLVNGEGAPIEDPDNVILLVSLLERDDGSNSDWRGSFEAAMTGDLAAAVNNGGSRSDLVATLKDRFNANVNTVRKIGFPNRDDQIGLSKELRLDNDDLKAARKGTTTKSLRFQGDGGADYTVNFELTSS